MTEAEVCDRCRRKAVLPVNWVQGRYKPGTKKCRGCGKVYPLLSPHDVAKEMDKAATRLLSILMEVRQTDGLRKEVERWGGEYLLQAVAQELKDWQIEPKPLPRG